MLQAHRCPLMDSPCVRGLDLRVAAVRLRQGLSSRRRGWKPVPDVRGPLRERPAVGYVTSAWGWSGSVGIWEAAPWGGGQFQLEREGCGGVLQSFTAHPPEAPAPPPAFRGGDCAQGGQPAPRATGIRPETESLGALTVSHLLGTVLERRWSR